MTSPLAGRFRVNSETTVMEGPLNPAVSGYVIVGRLTLSSASDHSGSRLCERPAEQEHARVRVSGRALDDSVTQQSSEKKTQPRTRRRDRHLKCVTDRWSRIARFGQSLSESHLGDTGTACLQNFQDEFGRKDRLREHCCAQRRELAFAGDSS